MLRIVLLLTAALLCTFLIRPAHSQVPNCGEKAANCWYSPVDCAGNVSLCKFIYQWTDNGDSNDFTIAARPTAFENRWYGIAFSSDDQMGDDCVVVCKSDGKVEHYFNPYTNPQWLDPVQKSVGLSNTNFSQWNDWFVCSFKRMKTNNAVKNYYDLASERFYLLGAYGFISPEFNVTTSDLKAHNGKDASNTSFSFNSEITLTSDCGVTRGCFLVPSSCKTSADCKYVFKYVRKENHTDFELHGKIDFFTSPSSWLAIGFSKDTIMGDDGVVLCRSDTKVIEHQYNIVERKTRPVLVDSSQPYVGITNTNVTIADAWLTCSFSRAIQSNSANMTKYFDLNNEYYIFAAVGPINTFSNPISKHKSFSSSDAKVNFSLLRAVVSVQKNYDKYKTHACLMVLAWMLFAPTGILFARYFKFLLPEKKFLGVDFWFFMHRPLVIFAALLTIVAFLVILAELNWKWIDIESKAAFTHSIFGIVTIAFVFVQPLVGFLRCDKGHKLRYVFNIVHKSLGYSGLLSSVVAMFLGSLLEDDMRLANNGWGIILGWTLWLILIVFILEYVQRKYEQTNATDATRSSYVVNDDLIFSSFIKRMKTAFLIAHVAITLAFTVALIVIIGNAQ